jgi:hypothetical protein
LCAPPYIGNKKHLEDYLDESGRNYWSTPNTPRSKNQLSREPSFDGAQNSQEKPTIMTKVHEKAKKWKQVLPYIKKHLNGHAHAHAHEKSQGVQADKVDAGTSTFGLGDIAGNMEERHADYLGALMNSSYPRTCIHFLSIATFYSF